MSAAPDRIAVRIVTRDGSTVRVAAVRTPGVDADGLTVYRLPAVVDPEQVSSVEAAALPACSGLRLIIG